MSKIVLSTEPIKVVNKGGFQRQSNEKLYAERNTALGMVKDARIGLRVTTKKVAGASYYVFVCPACDKRNKRAEERQKYATETRIAFVCNGCSRTVEMERAFGSTHQTPESRIVLP